MDSGYISFIRSKTAVYIPPVIELRSIIGITHPPRSLPDSFSSSCSRNTDCYRLL
jgi:hypothetical protein